MNLKTFQVNAGLVVKEILSVGGKALAIKADVSHETDVIAMIESAVANFGKIDVLVNNAGIVIDVPFLERTVEQWNKTLGTNLIGSFLCAKYASAYLKNEAGSSIINISSSNRIDYFSPDSVDYDASKAGVISLTKNLAAELSPEVRVNSVAPGWVNTDMNRDLLAEFIEEEVSKIYLKRLAEPSEIAKVVLFLASDDASFVTGSIVKVDGGY